MTKHWYSYKLFNLLILNRWILRGLRHHIYSSHRSSSGIIKFLTSDLTGCQGEQRQISDSNDSGTSHSWHISKTNIRVIVQTHYFWQQSTCFKKMRFSMLKMLDYSDQNFHPRLDAGTVFLYWNFWLRLMYVTRLTIVFEICWYRSILLPPPFLLVCWLLGYYSAQVIHYFFTQPILPSGTRSTVRSVAAFSKWLSSITRNIKETLLVRRLGEWDQHSEERNIRLPTLNPGGRPGIEISISSWPTNISMPDVFTFIGWDP